MRITSPVAAFQTTIRLQSTCSALQLSLCRCATRGSHDYSLCETFTLSSTQICVVRLLCKAVYRAIQHQHVKIHELMWNWTRDTICGICVCLLICLTSTVWGHAVGRSILTLPEAFTHFDKQHEDQAIFRMVYMEATTLQEQVRPAIVYSKHGIALHYSCDATMVHYAQQGRQLGGTWQGHELIWKLSY